MNHIARQFAILLGEGLKPLGIAPAQFPILLELWQKDGLSQQELVERADLKQATIANTLARMERDGLITREPNPDDARSRLIMLTEQARALQQQSEVRGPMAQLGILKCRLLLRSSESSLRFENKVQAA